MKTMSMNINTEVGIVNKNAVLILSVNSIPQQSTQQEAIYSNDESLRAD